MTAELEKIFLLNPPESAGTLNYRKCYPHTDNLENLECFSNVCRLCASVTEHIIPIFEGEGSEHNLAEKIDQHLPIQVHQTDSLPQQLCSACASTLLAWHELTQAARRADTALRARAQVLEARTLQEAKPGTSSDLNANSHSETEQPRLYDHDHSLKLIKSILVDYVKMLEINESELQYVCQVCSETFKDIGTLARHFLSAHAAAAASHALILDFIEENITFEETLSTEADSDSQEDLELESLRADSPIPPLPSHCCPFCELVFSVPSRLLLHLGAHDEVRGLNCRLCDLAFPRPKAFLEHLNDAHPRPLPSVFSCRSCGQVECDERSLRAHVARKHGARPDPVRTKPRNVNGLKYTPAVCPTCGRTFSNKYNMEAHVRRQHTAGPAPTWPCDRCGRRYRSVDACARHKALRHDGRLSFPCPICGERCPSADARRLHARLHTGESPHVCVLCDKTFRAKNSLLRHLDAHRDARPHECTRCPRKFRKHSHLVYHLGVHARRDPPASN